MKLKVLQENFSKALVTTSRFVSTRAQLPILGNILLKASKTKLTVSSTNLEISASISVGAQTEKEGEITVPGKVIAEIITNLPPETIFLEAEAEQLKIKTSSFSSNVLGMNSADFPQVPQSVNLKGAITISRKELSEALSLVTFAASIDETRPVLTGVLFVFEKGKLNLVGTDGFRLSQKKIDIGGPAKEQKIILPKGVLLEITRNTQTEGNVVFDFNQTEKQAVFGIEDAVFASRVIEGDFPGFEKIIPKSESTKVALNREDFLRAVKLASVFAREAANIVKLEVGKDLVKISAESSSAGNQEAKVEAAVTGEATEITFNFRFLEELLHALKSEDVQLSLSGPSSPAVFTSPKDPDFLHLIMPVRVQS